MNRSKTRFLFVVSVAAFSFVLFLCVGASTSVGQQGAGGMLLLPGTAFPTPGTVPIPLIQKTAPSSDGDSHTFLIDVHNPGPALANWAGVLAKVHVIDPAEVDVASVVLAPPSVAPFGTPGPFGGPFALGPVAVSPFGPPSGNMGSVPVTFTAVHPDYANSGITLPFSGIYPVIDINVNVKGSSGDNSDADLTVMVADIFHVPGMTFHLPGTPGGGPRPGSTLVTFFTPGSQVWTWFKSGQAFVTSNIYDVNGLHIAHTQGSQHTQGGLPIEENDPLIQDSNYYLRRPAQPSTGHWIHVDRTIRWHGLPATTVIHLSGGGPNGGAGSTVITLFGSYLYANPFGPVIATLGIEHIPEPTAPILLLGGMASLVCGFRSRRRRMQG